MPTIFSFFGFRFMFYSNDHEPIHVHVVKDSHEAKFNVEDAKLIENHGLKPSEIKMAEALVEENKETIIAAWNRYFNK